MDGEGQCLVQFQGSKTVLVNWPNILAQVEAAANTIPPLTAVGLLGAVLTWFMYQGAKLPAEIRTLAHRIDGLTRAMLADMMERESTGMKAKDYCRNEMAKIDARMRK